MQVLSDGSRVYDGKWPRRAVEQNRPCQAFPFSSRMSAGGSWSAYLHGNEVSEAESSPPKKPERVGLTLGPLSNVILVSRPSQARRRAHSGRSTTPERTRTCLERGAPIASRPHHFLDPKRKTPARHEDERLAHRLPRELQSLSSCNRCDSCSSQLTRRSPSVAPFEAEGLPCSLRKTGMESD